MEKYQPGAVVLQCGADSLAGSSIFSSLIHSFSIGRKSFFLLSFLSSFDIDPVMIFIYFCLSLCLTRFPILSITLSRSLSLSVSLSLNHSLSLSLFLSSTSISSSFSLSFLLSLSSSLFQNQILQVIDWVASIYP